MSRPLSELSDDQLLALTQPEGPQTAAVTKPLADLTDDELLAAAGKPPRRNPDKAMAHAIRDELIPALLDDAKRVAKSGVEGVGDLITAGGRMAGESQAYLDRLPSRVLGINLDEWQEKQDAQRRQDTVQRVARGQAVKDLGKFYETDPARDNKLDAQAAHMLGSVAPAVASGPGGVPLVTAEIALQMGEAERAAAIKRGDPTDVADARGKVAGAANAALAVVPGVPTRGAASFAEKVATKAAAGGTLLAGQDAALQKALDGEVDWGRTFKAGVAGTLLGGVLELPGAVAEVRARNDPYIREAMDFGFEGPRSELVGNGWLLRRAREAGFKGQNIGDLGEWINAHNEAVSAHVAGIRSRAQQAAKPAEAPVAAPVEALPAPKAEAEFDALTKQETPPETSLPAEPVTPETATIPAETKPETNLPAEVPTAATPLAKLTDDQLLALRPAEKAPEVDESGMVTHDHIKGPLKYSPPLFELQTAPAKGGGFVYRVSTQTSNQGYGTPWSTKTYPDQESAKRAGYEDAHGWLETVGQGETKKQTAELERLRSLVNVGRGDDASGLPAISNMTHEQKLAELKSYGVTHDFHGTPVEALADDSHGGLGAGFNLRQARIKQEFLKELKGYGITHTDDGTPIEKESAGILGHFVNLTRAHKNQEATGGMKPPKKPLPAIESMSRAQVSQELAGYGLRAYMLGMGYRSAEESAELLRVERALRAGPLPAERPALAASPTLPEGAANAADAITPAEAENEGAHGVAGGSEVTPPEPEVQTVYTFLGRKGKVPADQPPPAHTVSAEQWAELAPLKSKPDEFKAAFSRMLKANERLAKAVRKNATSREATVATKGSKLKFGSRPDGVTDIIDAIQELGGVPRPGPDAGGEFDGFAEAFRGPARILVRKETGHIDAFMQDLAASFPEFAHMEDFKVSELGDEVTRALSERARLKRAVAIEMQQGKFMEAALTGKGRSFAQKAGQPVPTDELQEGAKFKVKGEPFEVTEISPDDGSVTVKDGPRFGTQILPAGIEFFPDRGTYHPPETNPEVDALMEAPAEYNAGLATRLKQLRTEAQTRALTPDENAELDQLDRSLGQNFMDFYESEKGRAGAGLGDAEALQRAEIKRRAEGRLQAGDLESQIDLLGPTTDKAGQFSLFEDAAQKYISVHGVTDPVQQAALQQLLQGVWENRAAEKLKEDLNSDANRAQWEAAAREGKVYLQGQLDLPGTGGGSGDVAGVAGGKLLPRRRRPADESHGGLLGRLNTPGGYKELAQALSSPARVSSIVPEKVPFTTPALNWEGMLIAAPEDFAKLAVTLRDPYQERLTIAVVDKSNRILSAEVLTVGTITQSLVNPDGIARAIARHGKKAKGFFIAHNHPSGNPEPSSADHHITGKMYRIQWPNGVKFLDHIITNGQRFYSFKEMQVKLMPADVPKPAWEAVPREDLHRLDRASAFSNFIKTVRTHDQHGALVVYLNVRNFIVGVELLPPNIEEPVDLFTRAFASGSRFGATSVMLHKPTFSGWAAGKLGELFKQASTLDLLDVGSDQVPSFKNAGLWLAEMPPVKVSGDFNLQEATAPYDPNKPLMILDAKGNVVGAQELGGLEHIKPVEMPELVKLAREMTGVNVGLKRYRNYRGAFYPTGSKGYIKLNPKIFNDPIGAQRTLAHEIGHAADYQPDASMERGNLGGRIQSINQHMAQTFPLVPGKGNAITSKERGQMSREAAKGLGPRPDKQTDPAGWKAWGDKKTSIYQHLIEKRIKSGGLARESVVRSELLDLTMWWKPYDPETSSEHFVKYRESAVELYADALSVLLNAPHELKERAPVFYQSWFNYLDAKPDVKQQFFDLWTFLHRGKLGVLAERNARLAKSFGRGDEIFLRKAAERDARQNTLRGIIDSAKQKHFDIFSPIIDKARAVKASGRTIKWQEDPEYRFDAHPLANNDNYRLLDRVHKTIIQPLEAAGFTQDDLGLYLFHNRVLNEAYQVAGTDTGRSVLANPQGITPIQARHALLKMRMDFGPERMTAIENLARKFQDEIFAIIEQGGEAGIYSSENVKRARENRYNYASFAVLDYLEESAYIPAAIRQQRGTLEDIANPFTSSLLKGLTALKLIEHNTNKAATVGLLTDHFPDEITRAPETKMVLATGKVIRKPKPAPPGKEELVVLDDGKPETYWVEPEIARMFERLTPASAHALIKVLNWGFRNVIYPAFITYNPAFQLYLSPMRDLRRSFVNLPAGASRRKWIGQQVRTWEAAKSRLLNETSPADMGRRRQLQALRKQRPLTAVEKAELSMLDNRALVIETLATRAIGSPFDSFVRNPTREDYFGRLLQDYELLPPDKQATWKEAMVIKQARTLGQWIERTGMTFEAMPKMAAYRVLTRDLHWPAHQAAAYIRNHIGVPNYLRRGQWATVDGTILPFINVFMQGYAADFKQATGKALGPVEPAKQRFEWWRRMAENTLLPRLLQALAAAGVFGAALKAIYDGASEYDKANYTVIPLGLSNEETDSGFKKSVYLRVPEDETARVLGGTIHYLVQKAVNDDPAAKSSLSNLVAFGAGQVPAVNPMITLGSGWTSYAAGQNPIDQFRGEKVLSNVEFNAGGWEGTRGMLAWTWRETGGANFVRWDPHSNNVAELTVSAIPGLNRLIKVTDAGHKERQQTLEAFYDKRNAQIRVAMPEVVNRLLGEYYGLSALSADNRTPVQAYRLKTLAVWHSKVWKPNLEMMQQTDDPADWRATGQALGEMSDAWKK